MDVVLDDLDADCIKTGMLHSVDVIEIVAGVLSARAGSIPLIADPVMVAKGGAKLLDDGAHAALVSLILPHATVLTPNAPEAGALSGIDVVDEASQQRAGEALLKHGVGAVLVKGGHIEGTDVVDLLVMPDETVRFSDPRIDSVNTHGEQDRKSDQTRDRDGNNVKEITTVPRQFESHEHNQQDRKGNRRHRTHHRQIETANRVGGELRHQRRSAPDHHCEQRPESCQREKSRNRRDRRRGVFPGAQDGDSICDASNVTA